MSARLRQAVSTGAIEVHYQPIIDLTNGATVRLEALARWPEAGPLVGPDQFVRAAERCGWAPELDLHVLELVARQVSTWMAAGLHPTVSVNFSTCTLQDSRNVQHAIDILRRFRVDPTTIQIEVTETSRSELPEVAATLERFQTAGFRVSLDDFGTRDSLFDQLRSSAADELKIDREFIAEMDEPRVRTIVGSIIDLAHALEVEVVAEGVETDAELGWLLDLGCDFGQGFRFSPPVDAHDAFGLFDQTLDLTASLSLT
jgi:EAL domain-containing protein (putative c-di-GMP-specific phosphodiesterase class I)